MRAIKRSAVRLAAGAALATGLLAASQARRRRRGDHRVFILEYHDVTRGDHEPEMVVRASRFHSHLGYLKRHLRLVSLREAASRLATREGMDEDLGVITFDDGFAGNHELAWPALRAARVPAAIFVTTGFLDGGGLWFDTAGRAIRALRHRAPRHTPHTTSALRAIFGEWPSRRTDEDLIEHLKALAAPERTSAISRLHDLAQSGGPEAPLEPPARPLTWDQVRELAAAGIEIGCHTVSHPILAQLPSGQQEREIIDARDRIEQETGIRPTLFAYPNGGPGDFGPGTLEILKRAGFIAACTTIRGSNRPGCNLLQLKRIGVGADSSVMLAARLGGLFDETMRTWIPGI